MPFTYVFFHLGQLFKKQVLLITELFCLYKNVMKIKMTWYQYQPRKSPENAPFGMRLRPLWTDSYWLKVFCLRCDASKVTYIIM